MLKKDKELVVFSLNEDALKAVHLKTSPTETKVLNVVKRDTRDVPEDEWSNLIQSVVSEMNCKRATAICTVPSATVTTKNIEIPSLDPEEIKSIIDLQAGRHTPYSREEILVGHINIGVFQRNYTKVLLLIVRRDVIKKQLGFFEDAGVKVVKVLFAPEGMARFYAQALNVKEDDVPVGVINIGKESTDFTIEFNQTVATYRNILSGLNHLIKEGPAAQEKLLAELLKSIEAYQNEDVNKLPETYVLTSDDAKIKELQPVLQEKLKANVKIVPYLDRIVATQPVMLKFVSEYNDDSFLIEIAAAATCEDIQVDLTPDEIKTQRAIEEKGRQVVKTGIFALLLLMLFCGIFFSKIYFRSIYLSRLKEDYIEKRRAVAVLDKVAHKSRIIKDYVNSRLVGLEVLDEMYQLIPDEIYLENILLDEAGKIQIQGVSESMSRVFNFVSALEESELFKGVKTKSTTAKKERGKDVAAFDIVFRLESARDEPEPEEEEELEEEVEEE